MTDSTTAEGWMRKSNFSKPSTVPIQARMRVDAARKYAKIFMSADVKGYSRSTELTRTTIPNKNIKRPYLSSC
jgi:hypothetical protein